ncbi:MAG TPA: PTS sugar transporter subunit IIA [Niallia sp.]|nr:PTS sugar transporter subunit IIA [Niallia sp.]
MNFKIDEELIFIGDTFENDIEILDFLASELIKKGYVKSSYKDALIKRENEFPTGLDYGDYGVAIPHSDADHVLHSTLAIVVPSSPIYFNNMDGSGKVEVQLICNIVLKDKKNQTTMLSSLMGLFSNEEAVGEMISGDRSSIKKHLSELVTN